MKEVIIFQDLNIMKEVKQQVAVNLVPWYVHMIRTCTKKLT